MACPLTQGYSFLGCKGGAGGIKRVLITEFANKNTQTFLAGVITALSLDVGTLFRQYVLDKEMGFFSDNGAWTKASGTISYAPMVDFTIKGLTTPVRQELHLVAQNTLMIIVESKAGIYYMFGYDSGMDLMTWGMESGTAIIDFNGNKLHFEGQETIPVYEVAAGLIPALLLPGV
jgi:hypothetical protein